MRLGFARGVSPGKWARRWDATAEARGSGPLELVPLTLRGLPESDGDVDVTLERVPPGALPVGVVRGESGRIEGGSGSTEATRYTVPTRHAMPTRHTVPTRYAVQLYTESVALVVPAGHELAGSETIEAETLELIPLLAHPDHADSWPEAEAWEDPAWQPRDARAALELVASGVGAILMPLPLARHLSDRRAHAIIPVSATTESGSLRGTEIWASWDIERDDDEVQHLIGVLRGRTVRSGRARMQPKTQGKPQPKLQPKTPGGRIGARTQKRPARKRPRRR